jgi:hypothetical protein
VGRDRKVPQSPVFSRFFKNFLEKISQKWYNVSMAKKKLTPKQEKYVEARLKGNGRNASAILAEGNRNHATQLENSPTVQEELAKVRAAMAINSGVTKETVLEMLKSAADLAHLQGDATGLVAAARELGKMLGFYAPEVKKTLIGVDQMSLKKALQDMGEEELLRIAYAQTKTIEGESVRIEDKTG